ncbi:GntR family transcriptional regulator [Candidatus Stoquefichus massiliensis]|uniref:GntR family transcriptional regulator n=1 Tax=Candidatus Stoquefichus massiliensis TaxID=1470350 RepID=UPI000483BEF8|nr:GntR family transcriptional regulator [Candidatus Stoquefichus massiliensis]
MKLSYQSGQKPLWSQLYDILESRIINGEYKEGEVLPSEMLLMEEFNVSRITVRQAMDKLLNAKLISRKRGKGTIVLKCENTVATSFQSSFHGIEEKNNLNDRRVISVSYHKIPIDGAYFFDISSNQKVLKLVRQTYIDNQPVACYESYINPIVSLTAQDDLSGSLYMNLKNAGYPITRVIEKITAAIMTDKEKELFQITKKGAVMHRIRMGYCDEVPIEYTYSTYVANGYELMIDLK